MGVGRVIYVGVAVVLTMYSLICTLIAMLASVGNGLYMFSTNKKDLAIPNLECHSYHIVLNGPGVVAATTSSGSSLQGGNVIAIDLGLLYTVSLWNYYYYDGTTKTCMPAKFN